MTQLLLSVPHAACPSEPAHRHLCDSLAPAAARSIASAYGADSVHLLLGDVPRSIMDLNRARARDSTRYRERLRKLMRDNPHAVLLDVHSFPAGEASFGPTDVEVVLLDDSSPPEAYSFALRNTLLDADVSVRLMLGSRVNDIQEEARERGMRALLVEFNESLAQRRLDHIAGAVVRWLSNLGFFTSKEAEAATAAAAEAPETFERAVLAHFEHFWNAVYWEYAKRYVRAPPPEAYDRIIAEAVTSAKALAVEERWRSVLTERHLRHAQSSGTLAIHVTRFLRCLRSYNLALLRSVFPGTVKDPQLEGASVELMAQLEARMPARTTIQGPARQWFTNGCQKAMQDARESGLSIVEEFAQQRMQAHRALARRAGEQLDLLSHQY